MNITRQQYELYFLMYADNELQPQEKLVVEAFVAEHPDLAIELEQLMAVRLTDEPLGFHDKSSLMKGLSSVSANEDLLNLLDGELDAKAAQAINSQIQPGGSLEKEWQLLQRTQLKATAIVQFPNKAQLYRKEPARIMAFNFKRMLAAAAVLILLLAAVGLFFRKNQQGDQWVGNPSPVAPKNSVQQQSDGNIENSSLPTPQQNSVVNEKELAGANGSQEENGNAPKTMQSTQQVSPTVTNGTAQSNIVVLQKGERSAPVNQEKPSVQALENFNKQQSNESTVQNVSDRKNEKLEKVVLEELTNSIARSASTVGALSSPDIDISLAAPVRFSSNISALETESNGSDNKLLYMDEAVIRNSKVGAVVRKVKRVIERNTIIKSGRSIKIAGFEIAAR
jgi:hypothetical protein